MDLQVTAHDPNGSGVAKVVISKDGETVQEFGGGSVIYNVTTNGTYVITATDVAGNTKQETVTINNIDESKPSIIVDTYENENKEQVFQIKATDDLSGLIEVGIYKNSNLVKKYSLDNAPIFNENYVTSKNGTYTIKATDGVGNVETKEIVLSSYDEIAPVIESINYSKTELTKEPVTVTVKLNEAIQEVSGWTYVDDKTIRKTYTSNTTPNEKFYVYDLYGNYTQVTITVGNIDTTRPTINVTGYDDTVWTNTAKTLNVTSSDTNGIREVQVIKDEEIKYTSTVKDFNYTVYENGTYTFKAIDNGGNEQTKDISVNRIDLINPVIVSTNVEEKIGSVTMTMIVADNESGIDTVKVNGNSAIKVADNTYSYTATVNGDYTIVVTDKAGNSESVTHTINIPNLNIVPLSVELIYSENAQKPTKENVKVTISANKELQDIEGWTTSDDKLKLTKIYTETTTESVVVSDFNGNSIQKTVSVTIDKTKPNVSVSYSNTEVTNKEVVVTLRTNEKVQEIANWNIDETKTILTKTLYVNTNGNEQILVKDIAGNETVVTYNVSNIDKTAPVANVNYSTTDLTNEKVKVTISANEKIQKPTENTYDDWVLSEDGTSVSRDYTINTNETVTIKDIAGNSSDVRVTINNIDKSTLETRAVYSTSVPTKEGVTVTIFANKDILAPEGWQLLSGNTSITKTYFENVRNEKVTVTDIAGNEKDEYITIQNIDTEAPQVTNINYLPEVVTNENVIVTIKVNEEIQDTNAENGFVLMNDKKTISKEYAANKQETITIKDIAGNTKEVEINVSNIDKEKPELAINYSTTEITSGIVRATIVANEKIQEPSGWTISEDEKSIYKDYDVNTYELLTIFDKVGNSSEIRVNISNIDTEELRVNVSYIPNGILTNGTVKATITASKQLQGLTGWTLSEDKTILTKVFEDNINQMYTITDLAGNTKNVNILINNIDKDAPTVVGNVRYSTKSITNGEVVVTIEMNEQIQPVAGWTLSEDKTTLTKTFYTNTNGVEQIIVKDIAGNETPVTYNVTNIDKVEANLSVSYSTKEQTNGNVIVTITSDKTIQKAVSPDGTEWTLSNIVATKEYEANVNENITVYDLAGNSKVVNVAINNIDKQSPVIEASYSNENITNGDVLVTLTSNEKLQPLTGWDLSENQKVLTKSFTENVITVVTVKDLAGNTTDVDVIIENIDKQLPTYEVVYTPNAKTSGNVVVEIIASEAVQDVSGWTKSANAKVLTKEYSLNENENVIIKDIAGNTVTVPVNVTQIDKVAPIVRVSYSEKQETNEPVIVTLTADEEIKGISGWQLSSDKRSLARTFDDNINTIINVEDIVGNTTPVRVDIHNILNQDLEAEVTYSTKKITNGNVKVTITGTEKLVGMVGWDLSADELMLTRTYTRNTDTTVTVTDVFGNSAIKSINISNIDKTAPTADVSYSITNATNNGILVTIVADEEIFDVEGWDKVNEYTIAKKYFKNIRETIEIVDLAGNVTEVPIRISNYDKTPPVATIEYVPNSNWTKSNVVATITANEKLQPLTGWQLSEDKYVLTKEFRENYGDTVVIYDLVGNQTEVIVDVHNIDKTAPTETKVAVEEGTKKNNDWYDTDVMLVFNQGEDLQSGILKQLIQ